MEFERLEREPSLSDKVASRILGVIVTQHFAPGDRLPSERVLGEQFGVSRTVIREAVRSLAGRGVLKVRAGHGLEVAPVDHTALREPMTMYLRARPTVDYPKVHEIRELLEIQVAGLAAERATEADLMQLDATCAALPTAEGIEAITQADMEFHRCLCLATGNELFLVLLDAIADPLIAVRRSVFAMPSRLKRACDSHSKILECVHAHDTQGARVSMRAHLEEVELAWEQVSRPKAWGDQGRVKSQDVV
jgi:GntR family transcriptional regulator, transcriptional repressor for pyruvate dehydrogenase complex